MTQKTTTQKATKANGQQNPFEAAFAVTQQQFEKASAATFRSYDELAALGKDNFEAVVKASTTLAKGFEVLGEQWADLARASFETNAATFRDLMKCATFQDLLEVQTTYTKNSLDTLVQEGTKLGETSFKVANDAAQPIQAQVNVAVEKLIKPVAA